MTAEEEFQELKRERNHALATLDMKWGRENILLNGGRAYDEHFVLLTLHKARYECADIAAELRKESRLWLEQHGWHRKDNMPFPTSYDELPE